MNADLEAHLKKFYADAIVSLAEGSRDVSCVTTGLQILDLCLGTQGGLPRGRIIELFGKELSGKSTLALHAIAEIQKLGEMAAYVDIENAFDPKWSQVVGVDISPGKLLYIVPDHAEQALDIVYEIAKSQQCGLCVVDSVAGLLPKAELEGTLNDSMRIGLQAKIMSQGLRKISSALAKSNMILIFINQLRQRIGIFMGSPEITPGGMALKFWATVRIEVTLKAHIKNAAGLTIGHTVRVYIRKNKVGRPFQECELELLYDKGFCKEGALLDAAIRQGVIKSKAGGYYYFQETNLARGREGLKRALLNPNIAEPIKKAIANTLSPTD